MPESHSLAPQNNNIASQTSIHDTPKYSAFTLTIFALVLLAVGGTGGYFLRANKNQVSQPLASSVSSLSQVNSVKSTESLSTIKDKYHVTVILPSATNLKLEKHPFGEDWRENQMSVRMTDSNIAGAVFAWAEIDIVVVPSYGESLESFAKNHNIDYMNALFAPNLPGGKYEPSKLSQISKWGTDVYVYTYTDPNPSGFKTTFYMLKRGYEFILISAYINNKDYTDQYEKSINPILDSIQF